MHILIAEDDLTSRMVLMEFLKKEGHQVTSTVNGVEAWKILQYSDAPSLVILDWMMPEMDGLEVLRRVRAVQTNKPPYIIMLTAKGEKVDIIAGLDSGANDYLAKPFDRGELRARVMVGSRMVEMQNALVESREMLAHQANHDPLTELPNRRAIFEQQNKDMVRTVRQGEVLAVGMCDIDHFKQINDTYGHQTGDDMLRGLSQILKNNLRIYDSVGRIGGEEFLVVMTVSKDTDFIFFFNRICQILSSSRIKTRSGELSLTLSIGIACSSTKITIDELLDEADKQLYRAKMGGRNRVCYREN
jgi:two-component system cell cycle response regulator